MSKELKNNSNSYAEIKSGKSPRFKRGNPGRPKGAKDKIARNIKEGFDFVYEKLGGDVAFFEWVKKSTRNKELFYQWRAKMLPSNIGVGGNENAPPILIQIIRAKE